VSVDRADDPRLQAFDPAHLQVFPPNPNGTWVLLWPADGRWPSAPWVLEVHSPGLQTVLLHPPGGAAAQTAHLMHPDPKGWPAHGQLAFNIASMPVDGEPLRLHVDATGVIAAPMWFSAVRIDEHLRNDAFWLAFASACFAIMAATAIVALFFALRLRDPAFVHYSGFVFAYLVILAIQTGYAADPLGWTAFTAAPRVWGRIATALSVVFAVLFLDHFAHLRRYVPGGRRALIGFAGAIVGLALLAQVPDESAQSLARMLLNPLLILGGPLLLGVATLAAWRGSRYAVFFLVGWAPLLAMTVLGSAQLYGVAASWTWSDNVSLATGAFEALVLSLGLADRSLALRHDRDKARRLADIDALTGLYNRRAWTEQMLAAQTDLQRAGQAFSVLFLDLDQFKELNDRLGHEAGDAALRTLASVMREELREQDIIGRYGGEEFVVALPGADRTHASRVAERIRLRLDELAAADPSKAMRTVSIGAATLLAGEGTTRLLKRADDAMYAAKAAGRNKVVLAV
ncbi:MAG: sensor domain-containing diguanylate cyclase, partial [Rhodanobacteraceae bacterium]